MERLKVGDIVQHFKRETLADKNNSIYLYKILAFAEDTETKEKVVVYQALYSGYRDVNFGVYVRPYDMFMSVVDKEKYPDIQQVYRFELFVPEKKTPEQTASEFKEDAQRILNNVADKASKLVLEANKKYQAMRDDETELGQKTADTVKKAKTIFAKVVKVGAEEGRKLEKSVYKFVQQRAADVAREDAPKVDEANDVVDDVIVDENKDAE